MLMILSPAKTLDVSPAIPTGVKPTTPQFADDAAMLAAQLAALGEKKLASLMAISPTLAALNAQRYRDFSTTRPHPCAWMFSGDVYDGLDIDTLQKKHLPQLQQRLRILSGLYGVLRPFDAMCPYRLEMGTAWKTAQAKNLYGYWGDRVSAALQHAAAQAGTDTLLNLASQEYSAVVRPQALALTMIDVQFKQRKGNQLKVIGLFAKRARGAMARWVIEQKATLADLPHFALDHYRFESTLSQPHTLVFVRG